MCSAFLIYSPKARLTHLDTASKEITDIEITGEFMVSGNRVILPQQHLRSSGFVTSYVPLMDNQFQPASVDLRLGEKAYRVPASFLPGKGRKVSQRLDRLAMHEFDLRDSAVLERGCVYMVELAEEVALPKHVSGRTNPKSSTGRLDLFARVITDEGMAFDQIPKGYHGPLYLELAPRTFSVRVATGTRLVQLRLTDHAHKGDVIEPKEQMNFSVDITGFPASDFGLGTGLPPLIGFRARKHAGLIDFDKPNSYDVLDFWEPVFVRSGSGVILDPDEFYILATAEHVEVPANQAAEMIAYDTDVGELRVHYAGFFDPGFGIGAAGGSGSRGVLEVRTHEVPFLIETGQIIGSLVFEALTELPEQLYGQDLSSNYQGQNLKLAKQFKSF